MKKYLLIIAFLAGGFVKAQTADPFVNVVVNPGTMQQGNIGTLEVTLANLGNSDIVANSLEVTLSAGTSAEMVGIDTNNVGDPRWDVVSMTAGTNNTIVLRNNATIPASDGGVLYFQLQATVVADNVPVSGSIGYIAGGNSMLGGADNSTQGNLQTNNDFSTSSLTVTAVVPLPLTLLSFIGEAAGCDALLRWNTAAEKSMAQYEVEVSTDGRNYNRLGIVKAKADGGNSYEYRTAQSAGRAQYRLRMVGADGSVRYSNIAVVNVVCGETRFSVYPNPASSQLNVSGLAGGDRLQLYDAAGKLLVDRSATAFGMTFDISALPAGSYSLRVSGSRTEARPVTIVR